MRAFARGQKVLALPGHELVQCGASIQFKCQRKADVAAYIVRRIWQMVPTLAGVILLVFFLFKYFGGDPAEILGGLLATSEQIESIREQLGLNRPVWEQLAIFVRQIVTFDWGRSWATSEAVSNIFITRLPATLTVMVPILVFEVVLAIPLALGVALISSIRTYAVDLSHILFGNVLGVSPSDMWMTFGLGFAILGTVFLLYRPFLVISFDPVLAATLRLPAELLRNIMLILLAVTVVVSLQTVGIGLVAAMLVTPAATAYLLARRLAPMMFMSAAIGAFSSLVGLYISYYLNIVSGSAIVLTATAVFLVVFLLKRGRR